MRFHQLPPGTRFLYKGVSYVKTNTLTATPEAGGKAAIIPRSADVQPADIGGTTVPEPLGPQQQLARDLLSELYQYCRACLEQKAVDAACAEELERHYLALCRRAEAGQGADAAG